MSILEEMRIAREPNAGLAAVGVFWGCFAAYVPTLKAGINAPDAAFGLSMVASSIGGIFAMWAAPAVMARLGANGVAVAGLLLAAAFFYPVLAPNMVGFAIAMGFVGASISLLDIGANIRISALEARHGRHLMNVSHAMFSFAFAGSAFVASLLRSAGFAPITAFTLMAGVTLLLVLVMRHRGEWHPDAAAPEGADRSVPWWPIGITAAILFISFVSENTTETWSALHIERTLGGADGHGGFGPVALGLTMGFGRLAGQIAARTLGEAGLVLWSAVVGVVGALVIAFASTPAIAILGVGILGFGVAVVVPSANSILGKLVRPDQRAHAISRAWMVGFAGFFIGPSAMGVVAQIVSLRAVFVIVAVMLFLIVPLVMLIRRSPAPAPVQE
ncbi:MAG: MFS transporter [Proteobacteria bacterium]|nr:MFS transporter [Pseudomonadota bacterium]